MRFRLTINVIATASAFFFWLDSGRPINGAIFLFLALGTALSMIDYARHPKESA